MTRLGFVINLEACSDHRGCMVACKAKTNSFLGAHYIETHTVMDDNMDKPNTYFLPLLCQHCGNPSCVAACESGVFAKREDGLVTIGDVSVCKECADTPCLKACPYGAIDLDPVGHVIGKCDGCADLVDGGGMPACIPNCWMNAISFGDLDDPDSIPSQSKAQFGPMAHQLKPETGNEPGVWYLLASKQWRDMQGIYSPAWRNE